MSSSFHQSSSSSSSSVFPPSSSASTSDSYYVEDCRHLQQGLYSLQAHIAQVNRDLRYGNELAQTRSLIDDGIAQVTELQSALARIREYTLSAPSPVEKNQRRTMYKQFADRLAAAAKELEGQIEEYVRLSGERHA